MSPSIRIGLCLAALTVGLLLTADAMFDIMPDQREARMETRKKLCEALAVQFSSLAERDQRDVMRRTMNDLVGRNPEVISVGLRTADQNLLVATAEHASSWVAEEGEHSTPTHARVPIFDGQRRWGTLEVQFEPLTGVWYSTILKSPIFRLAVIFASIGFLLYTLFMKRTLRYLDPSSVIPGRVKAALDQLVEGVVLLDDRLRIVLSNDAFASKLDQEMTELIGKPLSSLGWGDVGSAGDDNRTLPWERARAELQRVTSVRLTLSTPEHGWRVLTCNVSPIGDGAGKPRGFLASFDDISEVEEMNRELALAVERLEDREQQIREKNVELERLATTDPLTGSFNRRAFFDKLAIEFDLARSENLALACIMADIDHFKNVNDTFGHAVGDDVIKQMAVLLMEHCTSNGAVGRYGGEEFCMVLPGSSHDDALAIADRIREALSEWSQGPDSATGGKRITSSFGVSTLEFRPEEPAALVDQADTALYYSKTHGRNQVTSWARCEMDPTPVAAAG